MKPKTRSIIGVLMMLVIIPIFAGLLACMPVPIGNPERSRIDPGMSGFWLLDNREGQAALYLFRPYDKRTWLVISVSLEEGDLAELEDLDTGTADGIVAALRAHPVGTRGVMPEDNPAVYKAWLSRIGGRRFLTWEPIGDVENRETFAPKVWLVFAIEDQRSDQYTMRMIDPDYDAFAALEDEREEEGWDPWKARKGWERVLQRNIADPDLYIGDALDMHRAPQDIADKASKLIEMTFEY